MSPNKVRHEFFDKCSLYIKYLVIWQFLFNFIYFILKPKEIIFWCVSSLQVKSHAAAWPFQVPVDPNEVPDYYDHIKYPMGG